MMRPVQGNLSTKHVIITHTLALGNEGAGGHVSRFRKHRQKFKARPKRCTPSGRLSQIIRERVHVFPWRVFECKSGCALSPMFNKKRLNEQIEVETLIILLLYTKSSLRTSSTKTGDNGNQGQKYCVVSSLYLSFIFQQFVSSAL